MKRARPRLLLRVMPPKFTGKNRPNWNRPPTWEEVDLTLRLSLALLLIG